VARGAIDVSLVSSYFASPSVWLVAPSMWIEQSMASYLLGLAVSLALGAIDVQ